jgi:hypothetical protein
MWRKIKMPPISSKTTLALALAVSSSLSGCATTVGTKLSTPFGYVNDHPNPTETSNYADVKTWAYGVSDGYSSRGTMNRYSLYWGAALAAGGVGALGGLAATGASGNANVIIPLAATFIGTLFGYYQNEELAQVYYSASDSINTLISKSEKRHALLSKAGFSSELTTKKCDDLASSQKNDLISRLTAKICADLASAQNERKELINSRDKIPQDAESLGNSTQTKISPDTLAALGKAVDLANARIAEAQVKIDLANKRKQNLELLLNSNPKSYEAGCLNEDVNDVIHRVHVHLALLDPQHVSEDLKNVKAPAGNTNDTSASATPPGANPPKQSASTATAFDLSDLDPKKIVSTCDVGL